MSHGQIHLVLSLVHTLEAAAAESLAAEAATTPHQPLARLLGVGAAAVTVEFGSDGCGDGEEGAEGWEAGADDGDGGFGLGPDAAVDEVPWNKVSVMLPLGRRYRREKGKWRKTYR